MAQRKADLYYLPTQTVPNKGAEPSAKEVDWSSGKEVVRSLNHPFSSWPWKLPGRTWISIPPPSISEVKKVLLGSCCWARWLPACSLSLLQGSWDPMQEWGRVGQCLAFSWNVLINGVKRGNKFASATLYSLPCSNQDVLPCVAVSPEPSVLLKTLDSIMWDETLPFCCFCVDPQIISPNFRYTEQNVFLMEKEASQEPRLWLGQ